MSSRVRARDVRFAPTTPTIKKFFENHFLEIYQDKKQEPKIRNKKSPASLKAKPDQNDRKGKRGRRKNLAPNQNPFPFVRS